MPENRINKLRKENGMNQKELGSMLGVGQTTISAWEMGKNEPDYESMHKMARYFRVSVGYLMGYESNPITGLSKEEREKYTEENREAFLKRLHEKEEQDALSEEYDPSEEFENNDFEEWQKTDQTTYYEFYQLNKMGDYLTEEQRERILNVAKAMFPNAEKGLYVKEIVENHKE